MVYFSALQNKVVFFLQRGTFKIRFSVGVVTRDKLKWLEANLTGFFFDSATFNVISYGKLHLHSPPFAAPSYISAWLTSSYRSREIFSCTPPITTCTSVIPVYILTLPWPLSLTQLYTDWSHCKCPITCPFSISCFVQNDRCKCDTPIYVCVYDSLQVEEMLAARSSPNLEDKRLTGRPPIPIQTICKYCPPSSLWERVMPWCQGPAYCV